MGGGFADNLSWRWAFLFQVPFIVVSTIMVWFLIDIPINPSKKPPLRRIDFLGATTLVTSLVLLLLGLNTSGNQLPWSHPLVITSLVLALCTLSAFLYIESTPSLVPEPMIPVSLIIRSRTVFCSYGVNWYFPSHTPFALTDLEPGSQQCPPSSQSTTSPYTSKPPCPSAPPAPVYASFPSPSPPPSALCLVASSCAKPGNTTPIMPSVLRSSSSAPHYYVHSRDKHLGSRLSYTLSPWVTGTEVCSP